MSWPNCQKDVQGCRMASSEGVLDPNSRHVRNFVVMQPMHLNRTSRSLLTTQDRTSGADFSGSCLPRLVKLYPETINRTIWAAAKAASQWDRQIWDHTRRFFQLCAASIDQPEFLSDAMDASSSWQSGQFSDIVGNQDPRYPSQCYLKATDTHLLSCWSLAQALSSDLASYQVLTWCGKGCTWKRVSNLLSRPRGSQIAIFAIYKPQTLRILQSPCGWTSQSLFCGGRDSWWSNLLVRECIMHCQCCGFQQDLK